jgi:hypothetical protein
MGSNEELSLSISHTHTLSLSLSLSQAEVSPEEWVAMKSIKAKFVARLGFRLEIELG